MRKGDVRLTVDLKTFSIKTVKTFARGGKKAGSGRSRSCSYLIFVIFFTLAKFLENKIYTEKRQFFALNLKKNATFRVKSIENANFAR